METKPAYTGKIAPCGMNCGLCIGHLRERNPCGGCFRMDDPNKPKSCRSCTIANCEKLDRNGSAYCYECSIFPCARLKRLDKRYREKYGMSMIENLEYIRQKGLEAFVTHEEERWACPECGAGLCVHRNYCLNCKKELPKRNQGK